MSNRTKLLGRAASAVAPNPGSGLLEPLISKEDERFHVDHEEEESSWLSSASVVVGVVILGAAGVAASVATMILEEATIAIYVSGGICIANSAIIVSNQYRLSKGCRLRKRINNLRMQVMQLSEETKILQEAVSDLQSQADLMQGCENHLNAIAEQQRSTAGEIVLLMKENEDILEKKKENLKQRFVIDMTKAFISSDCITDDMKVDLTRLPLVLLRLQIQLDVHGMNLDGNKFTEMIRRDKDISTIMKMCHDMLSLDEKGNFDAKADVMGLVSLNTSHSQGSVEVARGRASMLFGKPVRNSIVSDVKKRLTMRGIVGGIDFDRLREDLHLLDEEEEFVPVVRGSRQVARDFLEKVEEEEEEVKSKVSGKFKSAALSTMAFGGRKRDDEHMSVQQKSQAETTFNSAALSAVATSRGRSPTRELRSSSKHQDDGYDKSIDNSSQHESQTKMKFKSAALAVAAFDEKGLRGRSETRRIRKHQGDHHSQSIGTSSHRGRSVDKALYASRKMGVDFAPASFEEYTGTSSSIQTSSTIVRPSRRTKRDSGMSLGGSFIGSEYEVDDLSQSIGSVFRREATRKSSQVDDAEYLSSKGSIRKLPEDEFSFQSGTGQSRRHRGRPQRDSGMGNPSLAEDTRIGRKDETSIKKRTRSVDRALAAFRKSTGNVDDANSVSSVGRSVKSAQSTPCGHTSISSKSPKRSTNRRGKSASTALRKSSRRGDDNALSTSCARRGGDSRKLETSFVAKKSGIGRSSSMEEGITRNRSASHGKIKRSATMGVDATQTPPSFLGAKVAGVMRAASSLERRTQRSASREIRREVRRAAGLGGGSTMTPAGRLGSDSGGNRRRLDRQGSF